MGLLSSIGCIFSQQTSTEVSETKTTDNLGQKAITPELSMFEWAGPEQNICDYTPRMQEAILVL